MDSQDMDVVTRPKVVIIGAGPAGLVSARHLKEIADVQVFECKEDVGGLWNYTDLNEFNHPDIRSDMFYNLYGCLHGSLYKDLITNNPKHAMTFKDFCISKDYPNLMTNKQYLLYLRQYAEHFKLYDNIKFKTAVKGVKVDETEDHKFKITTVPANTNEGIEETISYCDFVLVWNGNQSVPVMPNYEGESEFEGKLFHIHSLRDIAKEDFDDKRILIVGGAVSGCDIAAVLLCYKNEEVNPKKIKLVVRSEYSKFTLIW